MFDAGVNLYPFLTIRRRRTSSRFQHGPSEDAKGTRASPHRLVLVQVQITLGIGETGEGCQRYGPANMEPNMQKGKEIWDAAQSETKTGDSKSAHVMRMYALSQMLAEAETAVLTGNAGRAAECLYELRLYAEPLAELLEPEKKAQALAAA
jgi:hypothetical protein